MNIFNEFCVDLFLVVKSLHILAVIKLICTLKCSHSHSNEEIVATRQLHPFVNFLKAKYICSTIVAKYKINSSPSTLPWKEPNNVDNSHGTRSLITINHIILLCRRYANDEFCLIREGRRRRGKVSNY